MTRVTTIILTTFACLVAQPLAAANWQQFYKTDEGTLHLADIDSLKMMSQGVWQVWVKTVFPKPAPADPVYMVRKLTINCSSSMLGIGGGALYYRPGKDPRMIDPASQPIDIIPDTVGGELSGVFCKDLPAETDKAKKTPDR